MEDPHGNRAPSAGGVEIGNGEDIESAAKLVSELLVDNSSFYMVREAWRICKQEMINLICFIRR